MTDDEWHADPAVLDASYKLDAQRWEDSYKNHSSEAVIKRVKVVMNGSGSKQQAQERVNNE